MVRWWRSSPRSAGRSSVSALILYGYPRDPAKLVFPADPPEPVRAANTPEAAASDFISPQVAPKKDGRCVCRRGRSRRILFGWIGPISRLSFRRWIHSKVAVPTLLVHGERDPVAPEDAQARLFVGLGTADKQWVVLRGGDHAALIEDTHAAFIAAIVAFVSRPTLH